VSGVSGSEHSEVDQRGAAGRTIGRNLLYELQIGCATAVWGACMGVDDVLTAFTVF
jgi:hypothetical protein